MGEQAAKGGRLPDAADGPAPAAVLDCALTCPFEAGPFSGSADKGLTEAGARGDAAGDRARKPLSEGNPDVERNNLALLAESSITDPGDLSSFRADLDRFHERAGRDGLAADEINRVYRAVGRLLSAGGDGAVKPEQRLRLAGQVMSQCARPETVDQGVHSTCSVATIESRMYRRSPGRAAELVADVATTGLFETAAGKLVRLDRQSLVPDAEAGDHPVADGRRSFASQLFQVTAINAYLAEKNAAQDPPGKVRYEQHQPASPGDTGERLVDYASQPPRALTDADGRFERAAGIPLSALKDLSRSISGLDEGDFVIVNRAHDSPAGAVSVDSDRQLGEVLADIKRSGRLPAIINVDSGIEPFFGDSDRGRAGGAGANHVVNVLDYDEETGRVRIDNQWGEKSDRQLSLRDLYLCTLPAGHDDIFSGMAADIKEARASGRPNFFKELELLRLERRDGRIDDSEYDAGLVRVMAEAEARRSPAAGGESDWARVYDKYRSMTDGMEFTRKHAIRSRLKAAR